MTIPYKGKNTIIRLFRYMRYLPYLIIGLVPFLFIIYVFFLLDKHAYWHPPIFFYLLALWIKHFGESIEILRILPFLLAFLSLVIFFFISLILFRYIYHF